MTLQIVFAHHSTPIPSTFENDGKPQNADTHSRQSQKWQSRRVAHFLLHQLFIQTGLNTALLANIHRTTSGRPFVTYPQIDFNISHSGKWVAVILSVSEPKRAVGIDIEHPQKIRPYHTLLERYASRREIAEIGNFNLLPSLNRLEQRFYLSWCLHEAVLKSQGVGIAKLAEVQHSLAQQTIQTPHSPQGKLYFYHQLPFYLAYFVEQPQSMLSSPLLSEWKNQQFVPISTLEPIIYQVNEYAQN